MVVMTREPGRVAPAVVAIVSYVSVKFVGNGIFDRVLDMQAGGTLLQLLDIYIYTGPRNCQRSDEIAAVTVVRQTQLLHRTPAEQVLTVILQLFREGPSKI